MAAPAAWEGDMSHSNECLDSRKNEPMFEEDLFFDIESNVTNKIEAMQEDCIAEEKVTPHEARTNIKDILGKLACNVVPANKRLHVQRKTI